jgi:hypothetical protein
MKQGKPKQPLGGQLYDLSRNPAWGAYLYLIVALCSVNCTQPTGRHVEHETKYLERDVCKFDVDSLLVIQPGTRYNFMGARPDLQDTFRQIISLSYSNMRDEIKPYLTPNMKSNLSQMEKNGRFYRNGPKYYPEAFTLLMYYYFNVDSYWRENDDYSGQLSSLGCNNEHAILVYETWMSFLVLIGGENPHKQDYLDHFYKRYSQLAKWQVAEYMKARVDFLVNTDIVVLEKRYSDLAKNGMLPRFLRNEIIELALISTEEGLISQEELDAIYSRWSSEYVDGYCVACVKYLLLKHRFDSIYIQTCDDCLKSAGRRDSSICSVLRIHYFIAHGKLNKVEKEIQVTSESMGKFLFNDHHMLRYGLLKSAEHKLLFIKGMYDEIADSFTDIAPNPIVPLNMDIYPDKRYRYISELNAHLDNKLDDKALAEVYSKYFD